MFAQYLTAGTSGDPDKPACNWLAGDMEACDKLIARGDGVLDQRFLKNDQGADD